MTARPSLTVPGRLARIPLFRLCLACGPVLAASRLAKGARADALA